MLLIEWMAERSEPFAFIDVVNELDFPKSSTLGLLRTLVNAGYVRKGADGRYSLTRLPGEPSGGNRALGTLRRHALGPLQSAVNEVGESGFIAVLERNGNVRYIVKLLPSREIRYDRDISVPRRPHQVSSGIILLGGMTDTQLAQYIRNEVGAGHFDGAPETLIAKVAAARARGIETNPRGVVEGAAGIASPIFDRNGQVIAALNIAGPADRLATQFDRIQQVVRATAAEVSEALAHLSASPKGK